ncbi:MAG TPA: class I SAM-dependent methyltransferase [Symbiobacteriaceae bacterium]
MKSRLARGYSRTAPLYDAVAGQYYVQGLRRLLPLLRVPPAPAVLDVGSGTGVNLLEVARWFGPARLLCGIDLSPGMVRVAQHKAALLGIPAHFTVGDAEQLPYPDGLFDLVICNSVFHWFRNRAAAMAEMCRVLRPGGQLVLICATAPAFAEWFALLDRIGRQLLGPRGAVDPPDLPTAREVAALLAANGFFIQHLYNPTTVRPILFPEPFIRLMSVVAPYWAADLTPAEQSAVELAAAAAMRASPGGFPVTWSSLEAVATRAG